MLFSLSNNACIIRRGEIIKISVCGIACENALEWLIKRVPMVMKVASPEIISFVKYQLGSN